MKAVNAEAASFPQKTHWRDLREWLSLLSAKNMLLQINTIVNPDEELSAVTYLAARREPSPAFLFNSFEKNPHDARVLTNMLGSSKARYAIAVGLDPSLTTRELIAATRALMKKRVAPIYLPNEQAPVFECRQIGDAIDLTQFPVPKFWPHDGGAFIGTGSVTFTRDPSTGRLNVGTYRQQLFGPARVGLNFVPGRHGELDCKAQWAEGKPAEVVVAYGIDPALFMVGSQRFGPNESELDAAGGLTGFPVELTRAEYVNLPIPARAELVIEGLVHPDDSEMEGPLGEFHGYYSGSPERKPVIEVKAVHFRKSPILTAALMATHPSGEIGAYQSIMRSARILDNLDQIGAPGVMGVYCHPAAAGANAIVVVALKQMYPGHSGQVLALTAQCPAANYYTKWVIAVDEDVDPTNFDEVLWALSTRCNPVEHIDFLRNTMSFRADPSLAPENKPYGSKALIDACMPFKHMAESPKRVHLAEETYKLVAGRWQQYGLPGSAPAVTHFESVPSLPKRQAGNVT